MNPTRLLSSSHHLGVAFAVPFVALLMLALPAHAIDLGPLWNYDKPELSEQRFRAALATANADDALILQTQIARTYGLRGNFARARETLAAVEPQLANASAEAKVRYALELGRTLVSATHPPASQTPQVREQARAVYRGAVELATANQLDALAIDALHMLAFVDTAPADQLKWAREALKVTDASTQPDARKWEAALRNNAGYALHQLGRFEEALSEFKTALLLRQRGTDEEAIREARWMIAWTLRALKRGDEALAIQLQLERECDAAGAPDRYVFEELEAHYRANGDTERADHYAARRKALPA